MPTDPPADKAGEPEGQIERLSEDLKDQMRLARDRIADRYAKLMEDRSFEPLPDKEPS
jgi:hypothetical protein